MKVFGQKKTKYLWCAWHVDRACEGKIKMIYKILQYKIYISLPPNFTNETSFRNLLAQLLTLCQEFSRLLTILN